MYSCQNCGITFHSRYAIIKHNQFVHGTTQYKCNFCESYFIRNAELEDHLRAHIKERPYNCKQCTKSYPSDRSLKTHLKSHSGDAFRIHSCALCNKLFPTITQLYSHIRSHTQEKTFRCHACGKQFKTKVHLERHQSVHEKKKCCPDCGGYYRDLTRHLGTHQKGRVHVCVFCEKGFYTNWMLTRHIHGHTKELPFNCELCDDEFPSSADKYDHIRRFHTKEKSHSCDKCERRFCTEHELKAHLITHTKRPYTCYRCGIGFRTERSLELHKRWKPSALVAVGRKCNAIARVAFNCVFCSRKYSNNVSFSRHIRVHIQELAYSCELCGKLFPLKCERNAHMMRHHKRK